MVRAVVTEIYPPERAGSTKTSGKAKLVGSGEVVEWISQQHRPGKAGSKFSVKLGMEVVGTRRRGSKYGLYGVAVPHDSTSPGRYG